MTSEPETGSETPPPSTNAWMTQVLLIAGTAIGLALLAAAILTLALERESNQAEPTALPTAVAGAPVEPPLQLQDFTLESTLGRPLSLSDLTANGWTLLFFGYTSCPDFCPTTMLDFIAVKAALGQDAEQVQFVFASVDPPRDTAERLSSFVARYDADFIGLVGDDDVYARIGPDYNLFYERRENVNSAENYLVDHSTRSYLIDPQGRLRMTFSYGSEPTGMADAIRPLLDESAGN